MGLITDSPKGLWSDLPLTAGIATLVCYAGVFNDVIEVEAMASRLGVPAAGRFKTALDDLRRQGRVIVRDGYAGLPGLENRLAIKASQAALARRLIESQLGRLRRIAKNPLIQFVGVSGSLAAGNPVRDRNNHLDLDVFLITRHPYLWLYRILRGIRSLFPWREPEPALCINYIMDAAHLQVPNRNFYTATEIRNVIPVSGLTFYRRFLQANSWANYYYPGLAGVGAPAADAPSGDLVNKGFFILYNLLRSIKWLDLKILRTTSFKTDLHRGTGPNLKGQAYGGYQAMAQKKFSRLAETWFPDLLNDAVIDRLFPDELSGEIKRGEIDLPAIILETGLGCDYGKYA